MRTALAMCVLCLAALLPGCTTRPSPPCPQDWMENPLEHACLRAIDPGTEVCTAYMDGSANQHVQCRAASTDGSAALTYDLQGGGSARVHVVDGDGVLEYNQTLGFSRSGIVPLTGAPGHWTLQVDFLEAGGAARIVLYG